MASIVQRGKSYCVVYYTVKDGVRKQKWESYHSQSEALFRKSIVEYHQRTKKLEAVVQPETVAQLLYEYVHLYGRAKWSLSMYTTSMGLIRNYIVPLFGTVQLKDLSPRLVAKLYSAFQDCKPNSPAALKSIQKLLHSAFEQAVLWEYVERNPFHKATIPKIRPMSQTLLLPEQIHVLLQRCENLWLRLAIELAFVCTLRRGELLALTWDDIDWNASSLRISKTICRVSKDAIIALNQRDIIQILPSNADNRTTLVIKAPKTETSHRTVYFPPSVRQSLLAWKNEQQKSAASINLGLIFANEDGRPIQGNLVTQCFCRLVAQCGFPKVTFHSLRHSSITYKLVLTSGDIKAVQGDSGHAQAGMITEIYGHMLDENRRKCVDRFEVKFYQSNGTTL